MDAKLNNNSRLGVSTWFFPDGFSPAEARSCAENDVKYIEVTSDEKDFALTLAEKKAKLEKMYQLMSANELIFQTYHIPYGEDWDISVLNENKRSENLERIMDLVEMVLSVAKPSVGFILHPSFEPIPVEERVARINAAKSSLRFLAAALYDLNPRVVFAVEDLPRSCLGRDSQEILQLISVDDNLKVCFDTNHLLTEDGLAFLDAVGNKVCCVHISDYDKVNERHWAPGIGVIDWQALAQKFKAVNYSGAFVYEVGPYCLGDNKTLWTVEELRGNYVHIFTNN